MPALCHLSLPSACDKSLCLIHDPRYTQEALAHPWFHTSLPSVLSLTFSRQGSMSQPDGLKHSESGSRSVMLERMRSYCRMGPLRRAVMHVVARDLLQGGNLAGMQVRSQSVITLVSAMLNSFCSCACCTPPPRICHCQ